MLLRGRHLVAGALVAYSFIMSVVPTTFAYLNPDLDSEYSFATGSLDRQIQLSLLFLAAIVVLYRHRATAIDFFRHVNPFLLLLVLYCLLSATWSVYPIVTIKRVAILFGFVLVGVAISPPLAGRYQFQRMLLTTLMAICILSAVTALVFPAIGIDALHGTAWRGITRQKNTLGVLAAYALLLWLFEWTRRDFRRSLCILGILFSLVILVMARSSTAIVTAFVAFCVYGYWYRSWLGGRASNAIVVLLPLGLILVGGHFYFVSVGHLPNWNEIVGPIAGLFDKGGDLTGRTEIWQLLLTSVRQHLALGIGYGSFWLGSGSPAQYIADTIGWMPLQGHDGYLDILNELGIVGAILFSLFIAWHVSSIVRLMSVDRQTAALHLAILCVILVSNITETDFLRDTDFQNLALVFSSVWLSGRLYALRQQPLTARQPRHAAARATPARGFRS